jgi:hypothetical protein
VPGLTRAPIGNANGRAKARPFLSTYLASFSERRLLAKRTKEEHNVGKIVRNGPPDMTKVFSQSQLQAIADALGDTALGLIAALCPHLVECELSGKMRAVTYSLVRIYG